MSECIMMVGLPGSGKTTWVNDNLVSTHRILSSDAVIDEVASMFDMTYDEAFPHLIKFASSVFEKEFKESLNLREPFVIDRTNLSIKGRKKYLDRLKSKGYVVKAVVLDLTDPNEHLRRLEVRSDLDGKTISDELLNSMMSGYQIPTLEEGFDEIVIFYT